MLRLWGLLSIYNLAAKTYLSEEKKAVGMRVLTWAQIGALAVFQGLENGAYLAGRGVLGWRRERVGRAYKWSARAWMGYVGLELVRLGWEWGRLRGELTAGGKGGEVKGAEGKVVELSGEKDVQLVGEQRERVEREWGNFYRRLGVNAAYAPMTVHYSLEEGPLGEGSLGALGVVVAWLTFGKVWRETA